MSVALLIRFYFLSCNFIDYCFHFVQIIYTWKIEDCQFYDSWNTEVSVQTLYKSQADIHIQNSSKKLIKTTTKSPDDIARAVITKP